ncbi:sensor histidine kinase [Saccharibacillus alkalitolerans]|uniref:histidine kinase n=1 Tax=Saccharibacillus alkalitolerans TaxID=2705290 RepID=A0ABX0F8C7_9BACL|nr:sensor histidine kinase [Saccharibacillus alkalitolerans]NGZ77206.1 sensor histidine kinase [Saccharibacillus alkalitolerans]
MDIDAVHQEAGERRQRRQGVVNQLSVARLPVLIWVTLVYIGSMVLQLISEPLLLQSLVFTALFTVHVLLYWAPYQVTTRQFWLYFLLQGCLIYLCAILLPGGHQGVLIGLLPVLVTQCVTLASPIKRAVWVTLISMFIYFDVALTIGRLNEVWDYLPFLLLMMVIVFAYGVLLNRQVEERVRLQRFLRELTEAHKKVEELTLQNERQRMARDLHDTLAQGLAGLIMRLEATNTHLAKGNTERAQEITRQSMQQARNTLAEARRAIDDLRAKASSEIDFKEAIEDEVRHFKEATGIAAFTDVNPVPFLPRWVMEHTLHIVKEALTNVARHAKADKVWLNVDKESEYMTIEIRDNGVGFNSGTIGKMTGHYGLIGLQERARLIGGELKVFSGGEGTVLKLDVPLEKGGSGIHV